MSDAPRPLDDLVVGLTFDDVLLVPARSAVTSRRDVDTSSLLLGEIRLESPIIAANMDTVCESAMAVTLAREGGIGFLHRFLTIEKQVKKVEQVKRAESIVIEKPYTIAAGRPAAEARALMDENGVAGLLVVEGDRRLLGILTGRDLRFEDDLGGKSVADLMTPAERLVTASSRTTAEDARRILREKRLEKLPLVDDEGRLAGLITASDLLKRARYPQATKDDKGRLRVGAAVGVRGEFLDRTDALVEAGVDVLVVDVAHGHTELALDAVAAIRKRTDVALVGGNVATAAGARDLIAAGADAVKVGVGPGSTCTTRIVTGAGVPQITAISEASRAAAELGKPVIADGGIRASGDIVKALAAGASTVMIGNMLGGTDESPGQTITRGGKRFKIHRGMASFGATLGRKERLDEEPMLFDVVAEGVEAMVPYRGRAAEIVRQLIGGLRSGMSYCGATSIDELHRVARFIRMSPAGLRESHPHDVEGI